MAATLVKIEAGDPRKARNLAQRWAAGKATAADIEAARVCKGKRTAPVARKVAELKAGATDVRLCLNLTRSQIQLRAGAFNEALRAISKFLGHIGCETVDAEDVGHFDAMTEVTR